jgi:hypothetical protein
MEDRTRPLPRLERRPHLVRREDSHPGCRRCVSSTPRNQRSAGSGQSAVVSSQQPAVSKQQSAGSSQQAISRQQSGRSLETRIPKPPNPQTPEPLNP